MLDYKKIGFKSGLEVHQRLESSKLFCRCPSILRDDKPDFTIKRRLRALAGETGEIDVAAAFEAQKNLEFYYEGYYDTTCLVELDEEPIHSINYQALDIALEICLLLNCKVEDEVFVMRKIVIDGSNTSGFQRTALLARDGFIETSKGRVKIGSVCLEEEAAKNIKEEKSQRVWRLDRLGIPLIEIMTDASIIDPMHAKEVGEKIGMILRSTSKVMRGIGSIRQDVNLSISGGKRVEIKGFQDIRTMPKIMEFEVKRQIDLLDKGLEIKAEVRKANEDGTTSYLRPLPGGARMYPETDIDSIIITKERLNKIVLPELISNKSIRFEKEHGLSGELAEIISKEKTKEFEGFVKRHKYIKPELIAKTLLLTLKDLKSRLKLDTSKISDKDLDEVFDALSKKEIPESAVSGVLEEKIKSDKFNFEKFKGVSIKEVEEFILDTIKKNKDLSINAIMGIVMEKYRGKIQGSAVMELIKKHK